MALSVPLSRFTPRVGGGSAFFVRQHQAHVFMSTLTKEQIGGLTPEQQQDFAALKLRRVAKHGQLLKLARGSQIPVVISGCLMGVMPFLAVFTHLSIPWVVGICFLVAVIFSYIAATNRRIDALLELYKREDDDAA